jgi:hypothetical protein
VDRDRDDCPQLHDRIFTPTRDNSPSALAFRIASWLTDTQRFVSPLETRRSALSNAFSVLLANILADESLRPALQTVCRMGYVTVEGRRVKFIAHERKPGHLDLTTAVESRWERIPDEDLSDLSLRHRYGEWRLEGSREWFTPKPAFELKGWHSLRFRPNHRSLDLICVSAPARKAGAKGMLRQEVKDFMARRYPDGIPQSCKIDAICEDFKNQTGRSVSSRTARRALDRK